MDLGFAKAFLECNASRHVHYDTRFSNLCVRLGTDQPGDPTTSQGY